MRVINSATSSVCRLPWGMRLTPGRWGALLGASLVVSLVGCHNLTGDQKLPAGTPDPSFYNNATGALGMRNVAMASFGRLLPLYITQTGMMTDELAKGIQEINLNGPGNSNKFPYALDERIMPELPYGDSRTYDTDKIYPMLQGVRAGLLQAIGQLAVYDASSEDTAVLKPAVDSVLRGELHALYGYAEIMLADFFCSGIPLSTVDFQHDFTYRAGVTTEVVYRDAIAHLDTALALSVDSVRIENLARVGLGRAYLNLGQVQAAADDVANVPTDFRYQFIQNWYVDGTLVGGAFNTINYYGTVADLEGGNGLPYVSSGDPRTADTRGIPASPSRFASFPKLYVAGLASVNALVPITLASGVEARLIEAEAALRRGDPSWLAILNALRTTGSIAGVYTRTCQANTTTHTGSPCPDSASAAPGETWQDTTWSAGTGVGLIPVASLADVGPNCPASATAPGTPCTDTVWYKGLHLLADPGTDSARIALVFRERAFWLYLTGHRQGDLRRQLRQYGQFWPDESMLYPSGFYIGGAGAYGVDVTAPIPQAEYLNPLFHGCLNRAP